jgi:hypothetical protein
VNDKQSYQDISDFLKNLPKNFNILEEQIDVEVQVSYFERSKSVRKLKINQDELDLSIDHLFMDNIDVESKKDLLIRLANVDDVKSYRAIETFLSQTEDSELKPWATLAIQESRMLMESSLLDEQQVFISTGLGGKGDKLRYFIVGFLNDDQVFSDNQKIALEKEFAFTLSENEAELEKIRFENKFVLINALIPIKAPIKELLKGAINECRDLGMDLSEHFMVTNVKELEIEEIEAFLSSELDQLEEGGTDD